MLLNYVIQLDLYDKLLEIAYNSITELRNKFNHYHSFGKRSLWWKSKYSYPSISYSVGLGTSLVEDFHGSGYAVIYSCFYYYSTDRNTMQNGESNWDVLLSLKLCWGLEIATMLMCIHLSTSILWSKEIYIFLSILYCNAFMIL